MSVTFCDREQTLMKKTQRSLSAHTLANLHHSVRYMGLYCSIMGLLAVFKEGVIYNAMVTLC